MYGSYNISRRPLTRLPGRIPQMVRHFVIRHADHVEPVAGILIQPRTGRVAPRSSGHVRAFVTRDLELGPVDRGKPLAADERRLDQYLAQAAGKEQASRLLNGNLTSVARSSHLIAQRRSRVIPAAVRSPCVPTARSRIRRRPSSPVSITLTTRRATAKATRPAPRSTCSRNPATPAGRVGNRRRQDQIVPRPQGQPMTHCTFSPRLTTNDGTKVALSN